MSKAPFAISIAVTLALKAPYVEILSWALAVKEFKLLKSSSILNVIWFALIKLSKNSIFSWLKTSFAIIGNTNNLTLDHILDKSIDMLHTPSVLDISSKFEKSANGKISIIAFIKAELLSSGSVVEEF